MFVTYKNLVAKQSYDQLIFLTKNFIPAKNVYQFHDKSLWLEKFDTLTMDAIYFE